MYAAVVHRFGNPLVIEDRPTPTPGPGQLLVRVEASGLCHTDIHAAHGDWPVKPDPAVRSRTRGCRHRHRVRRRRRPASPKATASPSRGWAGPAGRASGVHRDGRRCVRTSATRATRWTAGSPSTSSPRPRSSAACPTASTPSMPRRSRAPASPPTRRSRSPAPARRTSSPSSASAGSVTSRCSTPRSPAAPSRRSTSSTASCSSPRTSARPTPINAVHEDPVEVIQGLGGADAAIVLAATPTACEQAFRSLRRNGRLVFVGLPADNVMHLPIFETVLQRHHRHRVDRRNPRRPRRDVRAPRRRPHHGGPRAAPTRRGQRGDAPVEHGEVDARIVFDLR